MKPLATIEQHQDAWLTVFQFAYDMACKISADPNKRDDWLASQFDPPTCRAIQAAIERKRQHINQRSIKP